MNDLNPQPPTTAELAELDRLRTRFPHHLIDRKTIGGRIRYTAFGDKPHTVITHSLADLCAELEASAAHTAGN